MQEINIVNFSIDKSEVKDIVQSVNKNYTHAVNGLKLIPNFNSSSFKLTAGKAVFYNNSSSNKIEIDIPNRIINPPALLQTNSAAYISLTSTGNYHYQATPPQSWQLDDKLPIGAVTSLDGGQTINRIFPFIIDSSPRNKLSLDIGLINLTNTSIKPASGLQIQIESGRIRSTGRNYFNDKLNPNDIVFSGQNPGNISYLMVDGTFTQVLNAIDNKNYDNNGTLTRMNSGRGTIQYCYLSPTGDIAIVYGNKQYGNVTDAIDSIGSEIITKPDILSGFILNAAIAVKTNTTDLNDTVNSRIVPADRFGNLGGAI